MDLISMDEQIQLMDELNAMPAKMQNFNDYRDLNKKFD